MPCVLKTGSRVNVPGLLRYSPDNVSCVLTCKRASRTNAPKRMISFRRARKIRSYLVRTNLYPEESSFKCGSKRCEVCLNANETSTFTSTVTGETYIINPKFNCND